MDNEDERIRQRISKALGRKVEYGERLNNLFDELVNKIEELKEKESNNGTN